MEMVPDFLGKRSVDGLASGWEGPSSGIDDDWFVSPLFSRACQGCEIDGPLVYYSHLTTNTPKETLARLLQYLPKTDLSLRDWESLTTIYYRIIARISSETSQPNSIPTNLQKKHRSTECL